MFRAANRPDDPKWYKEPVAGFRNPNKGEATRPSDGHSIPVTALNIASGESFEKGALIRKNGSDEATELTAITETIYGVALESVVAGASLGVKTNKVSIARASFTDTERTNKTIKPRFAVVELNSTLPLAAHVGVKCALSYSGGNWSIDISDTGNQDVEVVGILPTRSEYLVHFLDAVIQS
jgi:hypothetical protein